MWSSYALQVEQFLRQLPLRKLIFATDKFLSTMVLSFSLDSASVLNKSMICCVLLKVKSKGCRGVDEIISHPLVSIR